MRFLPSAPFSLVALVIILGGVALLFRKNVPKAYGMAVLSMGIFLLDVLSGFFNVRPIQADLGFAPANFFAGDGWWTPLTSIFTHAPAAGRGIFNIHVISNVFILVAAGPALESRVGEKKFMLIFFVAAFAALVAHAILAYTTDIVRPGDLAIGASGGIFGILTAFAVRYPKEKLPIILFFILYLPAFFVLLIYLAFNLVYMLSPTGGIAWWGHFAGFLVGLAFAYTLPLSPASVVGTARGLPDADKLSVLAATPELRRIQDRIRQFTPETRTLDDSQYVDAWLDKFFAKALCPTCGKPFKRRGLKATCQSGETTVEFARQATRGAK